MLMAPTSSTHPTKTGLSCVALLLRRQETHNTFAVRPLAAFMFFRTAVRLFWMCTKCEELRANGIGRPDIAYPPLLAHQQPSLPQKSGPDGHEAARARKCLVQVAICPNLPSPIIFGYINCLS